MCRSIKPLYNFEPPATNAEIQAASWQFVRKISGMTRPSVVNQPAFDRAVDEIEATIVQLLDDLQTSATPKNRELETERARARSATRFTQRTA